MQWNKLSILAAFCVGFAFGTPSAGAAEFDLSADTAIVADFNKASVDVSEAVAVGGVDTLNMELKYRQPLPPPPPYRRDPNYRRPHHYPPPPPPPRHRRPPPRHW